MMKKNGFTLAEVLITLSIIGVIATLTLPTLMSNINESQNVAGFKKGLNTLAEAGQMNKVMAGYNYDEITSSNTSDDDEDVYSLYSLILRNVAINRELGSRDTANQGNSSNIAIYFNDGTSLIYAASTTTSHGSAVGGGEFYGFPAIYDVNGIKGPNRLSNCNGSQNTTTDNGDCSNKDNRVIQDRFAIRFRGTRAVPNGHAAWWALQK